MPENARTVIEQAKVFLGDRITTNAALRDHHSHGQDTQPPHLPDAVAFVETTEEAARLVGLCNAANVPVVPWGAGTSLEGHVTPVNGGITVDMSRMTGILQVSPEDMDCRIEAGVTRKQLNEHLRDQGLFFPVDPGTADCTIGGMCATRASGTNAVRYGTIRENVHRPDGRPAGRPDRPYRGAGAEVRNRLRPDAPVHRVRGHARADYRRSSFACTASPKRPPPRPASSPTCVPPSRR